MGASAGFRPLSYSPGVKIDEQRSEYQVESNRYAKLPERGVTGKEIVDQRGR